MKNLAAPVLIILWAYTGFDKILRFTESRKAFHNQTFPPGLEGILSFPIPGIELLLARLLLFSVLFLGILKPTLTQHLHPIPSEGLSRSYKRTN